MKTLVDPVEVYVHGRSALTFDDMNKTMKRIFPIVFACQMCTSVYAQHDSTIEAISPFGRLGHIVSYDEKYVTLETNKGKEFCGWLDLTFPRAYGVYTNSSLRFDQRIIENKEETITRTLISINVDKDKWHCYLIDDYHTDPLTHGKRKTQRQFTAYLGPANFIDDKTIVITPDYQLIAFRDYDHDGEDEVFTAYRQTVTQNGQLIPESKSALKLPPRWTCAFKAWGNSYYFNYGQSSFPLIPEPNKKTGFVCWGNNEYSLENLLVEDSDTHIRYPIQETSKSGKEGLFAPPPHTTKQAGPHLAVPADDS